MISAEALVRDNEKSLNMGDFVDAERPIIQQLFGSDPAMMAEATRKIDERYHPDGFDINMGCPVYKIVSNFNGAALMNDPERAAAIVRSGVGENSTRVDRSATVHRIRQSA
jgi:tRNA-dihydrouridine synthase